METEPQAILLHLTRRLLLMLVLLLLSWSLIKSVFQLVMDHPTVLVSIPYEKLLVEVFLELI